MYPNHVACDLCLIEDNKLVYAEHGYATTKDGRVLHLCDAHYKQHGKLAPKETSHE